MKLLLLIIGFFSSSLMCLAQNVQGIVTDMVNDKKYNFSYSSGTLAYNNNYLTRYLINEKSNSALRKVLINYEKATEQIEVTMFRMNMKDTIVDRYSMKYNDTLGLVFTQVRTVTDFLKGTYELVLAFKDSSRTFLEVLQVMNQSTVYKKHYVFRLLTSTDISKNKTFLNKLNSNISAPLVAQEPIKEQQNNVSPTQLTIQQKKVEDSKLLPTSSKTDSTNLSPKTLAPITSNQPIKSPDEQAPLNNQSNIPQQNPIKNIQPPNPTTSLPTTTPSPTSQNIPSKPPLTTTPQNNNTTSKPITPQTTGQAPLPSPSTSLFNGRLDSIDCIIVPATHEMVCVQIIIKGGVMNYPAPMQGIEPLLYSVLLNGATKTYTPEEIEAKKNALMMQTEAVFKPDYSVLQFTFPLSSWTEAMKLIGEMLGKPVMNTADIEEARGDVSLDMMTAKGNDWEQLRTLGTQIIYQGKMYDKTPWGDGSNLTKIQPDALKKLYTAIFNRNNILVVVNGKINSGTLRAALKSNFRWLSWGSNVINNIAPVDINVSSLTVIKDAEGQNIATCISNSPKPYSSDYAAFTLATLLLTDHINKVNAQKKFIDELHSTISDNNQSLFFLQFTASDADKAMQLIADEVKRLKKNAVSLSELSAIRQNYIATFYLEHANSNLWLDLSSDAAYYGYTPILDDWESTLQEVTSADVQRVMNKYVKAFRCFYTGNADAVNGIIFTQKLD